MELNSIVQLAPNEPVLEESSAQVLELNELQLALVGGGNGKVIIG